MDFDLTYFVHNHQHKGKPYALALKAAGMNPNMSKPDVALLDRDYVVNHNGEPRAVFKRYAEKGSVMMLYPHSALPPWWYDGLCPVHPATRCVFVIGEAQKRAMQFIAPQVRCEVAGWSWCEQKVFTSSGSPKRVLFAPIHPSGNKLREEAYQANRAIFNELKGLLKRKVIGQIVIRYIGDLTLQGLGRSNTAVWIRGKADGSVREIDDADVVIAEGTYLHLAVARGKPAIGINQHLPPRTNNDCKEPAHWEKYSGVLEYPNNYVEACLDEAIECAIIEEQTEWRKDNIGFQLESKDFARKVLEVYQEK